jgi:hypothetical protein
LLQKARLSLDGDSPNRGLYVRSPDQRELIQATSRPTRLGLHRMNLKSLSSFVRQDDLALHGFAHPHGGLL